MSAAPKAHENYPPEAHHDDDDDHEIKIIKKEEGEGPWLVSYADLMTLLMGFFALISSMSSPDTKKYEKMKEMSAEAFGEKYEAPYDKLGESLKKFIENEHLNDKVKFEVTLDGVKLTFEGTLFFESGDFQVKPEAAELMLKLAETIKKEPTSYKALIEGHTDSVPISHPIVSSNWELSGIRAARIAQIFNAKGFDNKSLTIIGWGATKPLVPDFDENSNPLPENMAKNRRVVLRVYDSKVTPDPVRE